MSGVNATGVLDGQPRNQGAAAAAPSTVVVVQDEAVPGARVLVALCPDDLALLRRELGCVGLDEVVGTSDTLTCEVCSQARAEQPDR
jgi:hypothetical protein